MINPLFTALVDTFSATPLDPGGAMAALLFHECPDPNLEVDPLDEWAWYFDSGDPDELIEVTRARDKGKVGGIMFICGPRDGSKPWMLLIVERTSQSYVQVYVPA